MYFDITDEALSLNHRADKAERRHYFAAKAETQPVTGSDEQTGEAADQSGSAEVTVVPNDTTGPDAVSSSQPEMPEHTTAAATAGESSAVSGTTANGSVKSFPEEDRDTIYMVIIAALICAVAAAAVILIKVIINGRKK